MTSLSGLQHWCRPVSVQCSDSDGSHVHQKQLTTVTQSSPPLRLGLTWLMNSELSGQSVMPETLPANPISSLPNLTSQSSDLVLDGTLCSANLGLVVFFFFLTYLLAEWLNRQGEIGGIHPKDTWNSPSELRLEGMLRKSGNQTLSPSPGLKGLEFSLLHRVSFS